MEKKYEDIRKISQAAYDFMMQFSEDRFPDGRYDLEDGVYVNIMTYTTKLRKECTYEAHKRYADVQFMLNGREIIAVEPLEAMHRADCLQAYDEQKDIELYAGNMDGIDYVIGNGEYVILMPEDGHMPGVCVGGPSQARKMVLKVPVA